MKENIIAIKFKSSHAQPAGEKAQELLKRVSEEAAVLENQRATTHTSWAAQ